MNHDEQGDRNTQIRNDHRLGLSVNDLSAKYELSKVRIRGILRAPGTTEVTRQVKEQEPVKPIKSPQGSLPGLPGKSGKCECCGLEFKARDIILRIPRIITLSEIQKKLVQTEAGPEFVDVETRKESWTGMRVCRFCSPVYDDGTLYRYELNIDQWIRRWLTGSDELVLR